MAILRGKSLRPVEAVLQIYPEKTGTEIRHRDLRNVNCATCGGPAVICDKQQMVRGKAET